MDDIYIIDLEDVLEYFMYSKYNPDNEIED